MANVVGDEILGKIARQQNEWFRRIREGSLSSEEILGVHQLLQDFADGKLPGLPGLARGTHELKRRELVIDLGADPFIPEGWEKVQHQSEGLWTWNPEEVELFISPEQTKGGRIQGHKLRKLLVGKRVLNANVLDYLLEHQELIPESWKGGYTFFFGTIYRGLDGKLCVRCIFEGGSKWDWNSVWIEGSFCSNFPVAVLAA